jgi:hypothetical protein
MTQQIPPRRLIKTHAKKAMTSPLCLRATLVLVGIQLALVGVRYLAGGTLTYALVSLASYGDTTSGLYFTAEGFSLIFRMDLTGMVLAIPVTYAQLKVFVLVNLVCFVLIAPLRLGAMEVYWKLLTAQTPKISAMLQWFTQARKFFKALVVEAVLGGVVRLVTLALSVPGFWLLYVFYSTTPDLASYGTVNALTQLAGSIWLVLAALLGFTLHCYWLPVRYCLAAHSEYSLGEVFRRGTWSTKGVRGAFVRFRLSYILFFFLSQVTYGAMDFYVAPYTALGSMSFIQGVGAARARVIADFARRQENAPMEEPPQENENQTNQDNDQNKED